VYRATDWEPVEISLVPVPADPNVGVGRAQDSGAKEFPVQFDQPVEATREIETAAAVISQEGKKTMSVEIVKDTLTAERARTQEITALAGQYPSILNKDRLAKFIGEDTTVGEVRKFVMDEQIKESQKNAVRNVNVADLTDEEKQKYSFIRAIAQAGEEEQPGFETEVSKSIAKALGKESSRHSIFVPVNVPMLLTKRDIEQQKRAGLATTSAGVGGNVVFTSMDSFIDFLYNRMKVMSLGATKLSGLRDTVAFPGQATLGTATWVAENPGSDVSDSDSSFNQITMSPKMLQASTSYSRKLLSQASIDVEAFVRNDLAMRNALAIDLAAINGLGSSNQPKGILNQSGIGSVVTGGAPLVNDNFVDLETAVAVANADVQNMATLTTPEVRGKLRKAPKLQNTLALPIWSDGGQVNGYRAEVSNQVPKTLSGGAGHGVIFGDWSQLLIGDWAAFEIIVDPFRLKKQGMIEVTTYNQMDCNVRYAASFAAIIDANPNA
jgi:HK97 family phage major capsid protein